VTNRDEVLQSKLVLASEDLDGVAPAFKVGQCRMRLERNLTLPVAPSFAPNPPRRSMLMHESCRR